MHSDFSYVQILNLIFAEILFIFFIFSVMSIIQYI